MSSKRGHLDKELPDFLSRCIPWCFFVEETIVSENYVPYDEIYEELELWAEELDPAADPDMDIGSIG